MLFRPKDDNSRYVFNFLEMIMNWKTTRQRKVRHTAGQIDECKRTIWILTDRYILCCKIGRCRDRQIDRYMDRWMDRKMDR